jgi:outer membrane lipoprotein-sorting protein
MLKKNPVILFLSPAFLLFTVLLSGTCALAASVDEDGGEIYTRFTDALEEMDSFQFDSVYLWKVEDRTVGECTLRYYLQRPDTYRVEVIDTEGEIAGILICDGSHSWSLWPKGTSLFSQYDESYVNEVEIYKKDRAYPGMSVSHQLSLLPQVCMPVFNANAFYGGGESVMEYLDDIEYLGEEEIEGEACHKLRVSMMEGQRVRTIWLSKIDNLPRKYFGELIVADPQTTREVWTNILVNPELDDALFEFAPPDNYEERRLPTLEERLLQVGDEAMPFKLQDSKGGILDTADYEGKIIWLMIWRIG